MWRCLQTHKDKKIISHIDKKKISHIDKRKISHINKKKIISHIDKKNIPCPVCEKMFAYQSSLNRHIRTIHAGYKGNVSD